MKNKITKTEGKKGRKEKYKYKKEKKATKRMKTDERTDRKKG